ncbi:MAG TPA: choice-of-anchor tandem repeat GloVer-containing protein, partial [Steroidobacteraceae bacterium]|nr:choice-of-anchor tandem repeat GloVer-containing protein [Steroidobacteraceae bacterium]
MQLSSRLRRLAAALVPCLLALCAAGEAQARSVDANLISFVPLAVSTVTDAPSAIRGNMIRASDGNFYVVSSAGGTGRGVIARIAPDGTLSVVYALASNDDGYTPYNGVIQGSDGNLYGTTAY